MTPTQSEPIRSCPKCGAALTANSLAGLCPNCLVMVTFDEENTATVAVSDSTAVEAAQPHVQPKPLMMSNIRYFGDYELIEEIARGGMGVVFKARQASLNRIVAVKMILGGQLATDADVKRFRTEAEAAANLDHPNVVPIYEVGEHGGQHYFSMKLIEGRSLAEVIRRDLDTHETKGGRDHCPRITDDAHHAITVALLAKVARAVHHAHQRGILHRDLKPGNILIDSTGEPHVTDFGLAKHFGNPPLASSDSGTPAEAGTPNDLTLSGAVLGTPAYMAPEQAQGKTKQLSTAADIYSLGAILYHLLTGRPPFQGGTPLEVLRQVVDKEPDRPGTIAPSVDRDLETICLKCLEKDPIHRHSSADALADELERWLRHEPILSRPSSRRERAVKWVRRNPVVAALCLIVCLVTVTGFFAVFHQWQRTEAALVLAQRNALAELTARAPSLKPRLTLRHEGPVASATFSGDGRQILSASHDGTARLWDATSGRVLTTFTGHTGVLSRAEFSPDGLRVLTVAHDSTAYVAWIDPVGEPKWQRGTAQPDDQTARVWDAASGRQLAVLTGHTGQVASANFSPDGRRVVTASEDQTARVWDAESGAELLVLSGSSSGVKDALFSPDGQRIITTSDGFKHIRGGWATEHEPKLARIWDSSSGAELAHLENQARGTPAFLLFVRGAYRSSRTGATLSPDGRLLATAAAHTGNLALWNARTGKLLTPLEGHAHEVNRALFNSDGTRLLTASADATAAIWDVGTGKLLVRLEAHEGPVLDAGLSPNGLRVVTASADGTARVWDAETGMGLAVLRGHEGKVLSARFSPDSSSVVTASEDHTLRVWNSASMDQLAIRLAGHRGKVHSVRFSPDGMKVVTAAADKTARIWDAAAGRELHVLRGMASIEDASHRDAFLGDVHSASFSPDNRFVATSSADARAAYQKAAQSLFGPSAPRAAGPPNNLPFTPVRIWDAHTGEELRGMGGHASGAKVATFSPDGRRLLSTSDGLETKVTFMTGLIKRGSWSSSGSTQGPTTARIWDTTTGKQLAVLEGHQGIIHSAAFTHDGNRVLTADTGAVRVWDSASGALLATLVEAGGAPFVRFSPDGHYILAKRRENAGVWNSTDGESVHLFAAEGSVTHAGFNAVASHVVTASSDGTVSVWDTATGSLLHKLDDPRGAVHHAAFSPDGNWIAAGGEDRTLRIWNIETGQLVAELEGHKDDISHVEFSPDGRWLGTASEDYTARLWPIHILATAQALGTLD